MDPATISLLISLAPSVLELLFGEGAKKFLYTNKMLYGYGKHRKRSRGGYVYPQVTDEKSQKKWLAAYELNKRLASKNTWVNFLKAKMPELKKEYHELRSAAAEAVEAEAEGRGTKHKRILKKIDEEIKKELEGLTDEDLAKIYHGSALQGYGRVSYKALAHAEAAKKGVKLPKSAKSVGKTWKEIYEDLLK